MSGASSSPVGASRKPVVSSQLRLPEAWQTASLASGSCSTLSRFRPASTGAKLRLTQLCRSMYIPTSGWHIPWDVKERVAPWSGECRQRRGHLVCTGRSICVGWPIEHPLNNNTSTRRHQIIPDDSLYIRTRLLTPGAHLFSGPGAEMRALQPILATARLSRRQRIDTGSPTRLGSRRMASVGVENLSSQPFPLALSSILWQVPINRRPLVHDTR